MVFRDEASGRSLESTGFSAAMNHSETARVMLPVLGKH